MADESTFLVRDKAGTFYAFTDDLLKKAALSDPEDLKAATKAWEQEEADVEGQDWFERFRVKTPTCIAGIRG